MGILQARVLDKMEQSSKRFTAPFVVFFIAFPVLIVTLVMYKNSNSALFETVLLKSHHNNVSNDLAGSTRGPNNTTNAGSPPPLPLEGRGAVHNITDNNIAIGDGIERHNSTVSEVRDQKIQNITATTEETVTPNNNHSSKLGSKNVSVTSSANNSKVRVAIPVYEDKLLHGLLASGVDEASCLSRTQFHLYRKASPHIPSQYLISKLRNYEEIHRKCGPNSRAYSRSMAKIEHSNNNGAANSKCKYLVWSPANGLGNQMISIVATFLYAVLTDRVLLVKFGKDKHGLFCEPFLNSAWILPEKSSFWNHFHVETYKSMLERNRINNTSQGNLVPPAVFINLAHTRDDPEKFFHCDQNQDLLKKVPLVILQSDQYFVPSLFMTPIFNDKINKMFPEKDTIFHHLGRYLYHPSNEAWGLISRFYQKNLAKANERIGLQIRVFNPPATPKQAVMNLVLNCTIKNKLLPEVLSVQNSISSTMKNQTTMAVLVASLYPEYGENLRAMYLEKQTVTGEVVQVYQPSHEGHQKFGNNIHNLKAWVDMYLLSLSDVLVTTSVSTFGYVAQGLGNLRPWLLYRLAGDQNPSPACIRGISMEPCFHYPPKHFCKGKSIEDFESSFIQLRKCQDYSFGVKLVNGSVL